MKETELNKVLNYMKQYVENIYEHDSEPMLNYKDLQIVLDYITNLEKEKQEMKDGWQQEVYDKNEILNKWYETQRRINKAIDELYYLESNCDITELGSIKLKQILKGE